MDGSELELYIDRSRLEEHARVKKPAGNAFKGKQDLSQNDSLH
jgi:hypothetical protein